MSKKIEKPRQFIRYNRSDVTVFIREKGENLAYVELLNISQQGVSFRIASNMKLKKHLELIIKFDKNHTFELKGYIIYKFKDMIEAKTQFMERVWGVIMPGYSSHKYGISFKKNK